MSVPVAFGCGFGAGIVLTILVLVGISWLLLRPGREPDELDWSQE